MPASEERMCLDVTTINQNKHNLIKGNLIIWDYHGGPNQHFYFKKVGEDLYILINSATGHVIEVADCSRLNNEKLVVSP